jgi:hypothetical protein
VQAYLHHKKRKVLFSKVDAVKAVRSNGDATKTVGGGPKQPQVVRLLHKEKKSAKSSGQAGPSPPKKEKIRGHEYNKWDKFDVEEECKKLDEGKWRSSFRRI